MMLRRAGVTRWMMAASAIMRRDFALTRRRYPRQRIAHRRALATGGQIPKPPAPAYNLCVRWPRATKTAHSEGRATAPRCTRLQSARAASTPHARAPTGGGGRKKTPAPAEVLTTELPNVAGEQKYPERGGKQNIHPRNEQMPAPRRHIVFVIILAAG